MSWQSRVETACDRAACGAALFMLSAPALAFGGEHDWARPAIEVVAAGLGVIWGARLLWGSPVPRRATRSSTARGLIVALLCLLALPLLAVPPAVLQRLAPRAFEITARALPGWPAQEPFTEVFATAAVPAVDAATQTARRPASWRPVAMVPWETARTLSLGAAYALVAGVVAFYPWPRRGRAVLQRLASALIALAVLETLYAFVQWTRALRQVFWFDCLAGTSCTGTFLNRNHFAGLLEMVVPLVLARAGTAAVQIPRSLLGGRKRWGDLLELRSDPCGGRMLAYVATASILIIGLAVSGSRSAFVVTLGSLAAMVPLRPSARPAARPVRGLGLPIALTLLAAVWLTFPQLRQRFSLSDPFRAALGPDVMTMLADFPVLGVGLGNFGTTYPYYRSVPFDLWAFGIDHAHNDYLEWVAEVGVPAALLSAALLLRHGAQVVQRLRLAAARSREAWMLWGCTTGVVALLVHALTDSNLHVPANALVFAFLLGCIVRLARPAAEVEAYTGTGPRTRRPLALLGVALCVVWIASVAQRWRAEAAYASVYPDARLRDLSAPRAALAGDAAVAALQGAAAAAATAPHIQAGLGRQLLRRATDGSAATPDSIALDGAIHAFVRSLAAAPLQPDTLLDLVAALEARAAANRPALRPVLDDLVGRAAALAPYDPEVQLRIADWHLRRWKTLAAAERARAAPRIEAALALAAQAPALAERRRETEARYEWARGIGTGGRAREGG